MINTTVYCKDKEELALFVNELLHPFAKLTYAWITITSPEKSEAYSVSIVTDTSSADTVKSLVQNYFGLHMTISSVGTPDGLFL
jgi:hypothetical protein